MVCYALVSWYFEIESALGSIELDSCEVILFGSSALIYSVSANTVAAANICGKFVLQKNVRINKTPIHHNWSAFRRKEANLFEKHNISTSNEVNCLQCSSKHYIRCNYVKASYVKIVRIFLLKSVRRVVCLEIWLKSTHFPNNLLARKSK